MFLAALLITLPHGVASPKRIVARDSLLVPGVSLALARERAAQLSDIRYDLALDVTQRDSALGRVTIRFTSRQAKDVILDFRGPALRRIRVNGSSPRDIEWTGHHVRIPAELLANGVNRVDIEFSSRIAAAGASIIRVRDPADSATYLYTLLVPSDAQQLFPCFDQPDLKARVNLTLTTPIGWRAVANGSVLHADSSSRGTTFVFAQTEPISTYLIAFAAGPWATFTATGSRPITLYVRRSRAKEVDAETIIRDGDRAVGWLEEYFAYRYPFHKLDLLLAPAFPFGGMEHPGAIFFSEERFIFREAPTLPQRLGRTATVYHEVAHQWFGDLVTMQWFDDLWLKEGFATYMAAKMQAALDPGSDAWKTFYLRNKPLAYAIDATEGTTAIWQPLSNLDQAKSNYGPIVYNKAPGVLKQLNMMVGDDAFRDGLRRFVRAHAFANATWRDLLDAVAASWKRPLRAWGEAYIMRRGMPVLSQRLEIKDDRLTKLLILQRPARLLSGTQPWPIRTDVFVATDPAGVPTRIPVTITAESTLVEAAAGLPAPAWMFANADDNAYALVLLDPGSVAWLERSLSAVKDGFQRAMLWGALWDLVREAYLSPERFIRLAERELPGERDEQIASVVLSRLTRAASAYLVEAKRDAYLPELERMLIAGAADTSRAYGIRKAHLDALIRVASTPSALRTLDAMLDGERFAGMPVGPPSRWAIVTRLVARDAPGAARRLAAESTRDATAEGARRAFVARAARPSADDKQEYFARYFADSTLNEDWATASLDGFNALESRSLTMRYLRTSLDSLPWIQRNRRIFYLGSWLSSFLEGQVDADALTTVRKFLAERTDLAPDLRAKVLQSADELERTVHIRKTFTNE